MTSPVEVCGSRP